MSCTDKKFTKSGQLIAVNVSDCVDAQVTVGDIKYCSDQTSPHHELCWHPADGDACEEACP